MPKTGAWPRRLDARVSEPQPYSNGHAYPPPLPSSAPDLTMGLTLGQLLAGQERQIFVSEMIVQRLDDLPQKLAEQLPLPASAQSHPPAVTSPPAEKLTLWQIAQLIMAGIVIASAVATKTPLKDVLPSVMKPIG